MPVHLAPPARRYRPVIADPNGRLVWASPAPPGATHDLSAAGTITDILASANAGPSPIAATGAPSDGDLAGSTEYRAVSEILQKRCRLRLPRHRLSGHHRHHVRRHHRTRDHVLVI